MELASLREAKVDALRGAADAYDTLRGSVDADLAQWQTGTVAAVTASGWCGRAADLAGPALTSSTSRLQAAVEELGSIGAKLRAAADALRLAQAKLVKALADADAELLTVDDSGDVRWGPPTRPDDQDDPAHWNARQQAAAEGVSRRIQAALAEATAEDQDLAQALRHFTANATGGAGPDPAAAAADQAQTRLDGMHPEYLQGMPPAGALPSTVNAWWNALTPDEQQWFVTEHPQQIGNLDGIPATVRDQANRAWLAATVTALNQEQHPTPEQRQQLAKLRPVQQRLDADAKALDGRPRDFLLGIGTEGQGRAILSFGDPDVATDICTYVPGMTCDPASLGPDDGALDGSNEAGNALWAWRSAQQKEPPGRTAASIIWLGYDAPPAGPPVATCERAAAGAPAYARFLDGLRSTNGSAGLPHLTSIGHSYGSLLVGTATKLATRPDSRYRPPDDVVLIGSPGVGATSAQELGLPGHVWAGAAGNDPVTHLPGARDIYATAAGGALLGPLGAVIGHQQGDPHHLPFGQDPAGKGFGANRFTVDDHSAGLDVVAAHLKYLTPVNGGPSLANIGNIVTAHYAQVQREPGR
ncbi:alpha/beta hydrolase [Kitasatospora sp. LaBMicrA B282]|uniref:alpha/beta hydrolase n=1 Tax=Kitasatospora sp. LaBMicrA B282 TaxID=3420949 RepID=UPI003D100B0F